MDTTYAMDVPDKWGEKMSKLIRYDDAIERLGAHLMADAQIDWGETASTDIEDWKELADMILNGVPTIDAVSVDEWCHDCKEYDKEKHSCPRFNRVIRTALKDADMVSVVRCKDCKHRTYCYSDVFMTNKSQTADIYKSVNFCSYGEREKDHE